MLTMELFCLIIKWWFETEKAHSECYTNIRQTKTIITQSLFMILGTFDLNDRSRLKHRVNPNWISLSSEHGQIYLFQGKLCLLWTSCTKKAANFFASYLQNRALCVQAWKTSAFQYWNNPVVYVFAHFVGPYSWNTHWVTFRKIRKNHLKNWCTQLFGQAFFSNLNQKALKCNRPITVVVVCFFWHENRNGSRLENHSIEIRDRWP